LKALAVCKQFVRMPDWEKCMVPPSTHRGWRELIVGDDPIASSHFGFNLLLTNKRIFYRREPSEENLAALTEHIHEYFSKYEGLYQDELKLIFGDDYHSLDDSLA
jgi:hypothetical protein